MEQNTDTLDKMVKLSLLYDFYGALLKEHKRKIFEDYIQNDYSLGEIAQICSISRQGVYDLVKRCIKELEEYENKLCLISRFQKTKAKVKQIQENAEEIRSAAFAEQGGSGRQKASDQFERLAAKIEEIQTLADEILAEL